MPQSLPRSLRRDEARRVALAAQGFARPDPATVGTRQLNDALRRMHVLQIDSVNVFARSHYMPLFSRLGAYDTAALDRLLFARRAPYIESWAHVASFVPSSDWPLLGFRRTANRERYAGPGTWFAEHADTVQWVRSELAGRGPLRPAEIEQDDAAMRRGPWWDWSDVKRALEVLFLIGEVSIAGRRGFERIYGLTEDVIPAEFLGRDLSRDDAVRELVRRAARAYGVATIADLDDYWRLRDQRTVRRVVDELTDAGELVETRVEGWMLGGRAAPAWMHSGAVVPRRVDAATILTPFDPTVWFRDRAHRLFGFDYRIEIYTPAPRRRFGYYSLPVLIGDDIVGRVDLKADRSDGRLLVQSAWWEADPPPDAAPRVAGVLREAARWQGLDAISVSQWGTATSDLARELPEADRHDAGATAVPAALAPDEPDNAADPAP